MHLSPVALAKVATRFARQDCVSWEDLVSSAAEVVFFGSRAAGVNTSFSDLDVLFIGPSNRRVSRHLDMIWRDRRECESPNWLRSELATHVARYGVWVVGEGHWRTEVRVGERAIIQKARRIAKLAESLNTYWPKLHPDFRHKYLMMIRREGQRLTILLEGNAVPPTPLLDQGWNLHDVTIKRWMYAMRSVATGELCSRNRLLRTAHAATLPASALSALLKQDSLQLALYRK